MNTTECTGCKARFRDMEGPTHPYMESSPGCWAAFGDVLAREYSDPVYFEVHRLGRLGQPQQYHQIMAPQLNRDLLGYTLGLRPLEFSKAAKSVGLAR